MSDQRLTQSSQNAKQWMAHRESRPDPAPSFHGGLHFILQLQRTIGNHAVGRLIQAQRLIPQGKILGLQRKLTVGAANDPYEQEADRVARQVLNTPDAGVQRTCATCVAGAPPCPKCKTEKQELLQRQIEPEEEEKGPVQAKPLDGQITPLVQRQVGKDDEDDERIQAASVGTQTDSFEAGTDVETRLSLSKGHGSPLPDSVRAYMEPRFGVDFSYVRAHTGSDAQQMNQAVGAQAFTHGSDIYFSAGSSPANLELTAHELTHVVQQAGAAVQRQEPKEAGGERGADADSSPHIIQQAATPLCAGSIQPQPGNAFSATGSTLQRQAAPQLANTPTPGQQAQSPPASQPAPPQLTITRQNAQVTPDQTTGDITSVLSISGAVPNSNLAITVRAIQSSGHTHAGNRPLGRVAPAPAVAKQNGEATATYTAGVVAGTERITVTEVADQGQQRESQCDIDVHVPNLQQLGPDPTYELTGATATHLSNHFALPTTNTALQALAADFVTIHDQALPLIQQRISQLQQPPAPPAQVSPAGAPPAPQATAQPLNDQQMATHLANPASPNLQGLALNQLQQLLAALANWPLLGYNDLSLEHGGSFDINGNWTAPHITHRIGNTLDFRISNLNSLHRLLVRPIIAKHGAQILDEGNHWHLTF